MQLKLANDYFDCDPERFPRRGSEGKFCFPEGPQGWVGGGGGGDDPDPLLFKIRSRMTLSCKNVRNICNRLEKFSFNDE